LLLPVGRFSAVQFKFEPEDEDEFEAVSSELLARFEATKAGEGLGWVAVQVLSFKWEYLDGDLGSWSNDDVRAILLDLYPRKVALGPNEDSEVIAGFAGLLLFLADEDLLEASRAHRLARTVEATGHAFSSAMADETRFGMGKRLVAAMRADGVDPTDQENMDAWVARFNERPFAERDRIIGPPLSQPRVGDVGAAALGRLPPVVLEPESELEVMARNSVLFERVVRLVDFIGDGRMLTDRGNLTVADGKQLVDLLETDDQVDTRIGDHVYRTRSSTELVGVDLAFCVALEAGFLEAAGKRRARAHDRALFREEPLEAHYRLLLALLHRIGPTAHHYGDRDTYGFGWFAEELDHDLLPVLIGLYREQAAKLIDDISSGCWDRLLEIYDLDDVEDDKLEFHHGLVADALRRALRRLEELNVVVREGIEYRPREFGGTEESGGSVSLSALGTWSLQRLLSTATDAPVAGSLSECDAGDLLKRAADLPEDLATLEIDNWNGAHGQEGARLLVESMPASDDTGRALGFRALQRMGPAAASAVSQLADHAELGAYASVWQVQTGAGSREGLDASGDPERFIRLLYAALVLWGPEAVCERLNDVSGRAGVGASLDAVWRVRSPETEAVLAVVGDLYPDKAVAKAARKSLFRFRSSGGAGQG
jgi:hypothetical protein